MNANSGNVNSAPGRARGQKRDHDFRPAVDNIDLGASIRTVRVEDNPASVADVAVLSGQLSGSGGIDKMGPGTLLLNGANINTGLSSVIEGTLGGTGIVGGNLANNSIVAPGASIGTITVNGDYGQTGTLEIEIADLFNHDILAVGGTATLGGDLWIDWQGPGRPAYGTVFDVITAPTIIDNGLTITGDFSGWFGLRMAEGEGMVLQVITTIPEPASMILLAAGLLPLFHRRR